MNALHNPRARLSDAEREARAFLRTTRIVASEVLYVRGYVGSENKLFDYFSPVDWDRIPFNMIYRDEDYELAVRLVHEETISYFFVRKNSKENCVAAVLLHSNDLNYAWVSEILLRAGYPFYKKQMDLLHDVKYLRRLPEVVNVRPLLNGKRVRLTVNEKHVQSLSDNKFPEYVIGLSLRKKLDVLWLFWSVVPANAFSKIVKHFFSR